MMFFSKYLAPSLLIVTAGISPALAQSVEQGGQALVDPRYLLALIPLMLAFEWPFIKKITGFSWLKSLIPLVFASFLGFLIQAALVLFLSIPFVFIAFSYQVWGEFFASVMIYGAQPVLYVITFAGVELILIKILYWVTMKLKWSDLWWLCIPQTVKIGFIILAAYLAGIDMGAFPAINIADALL